MRISTFLLCTCLLLVFPATGHTQEVERVEPPFWWTGFEHSELQLLIHGNNISLLTPSIDVPGISISRIVRVESPNYLFLYLDIGVDAEPTAFDIVFEDGDFSVSHTYELRPRNPDPDHVKGFTSADTMYLIMPDRFANGDPDNDEFYFLDDKLKRDDPYGRHGGDLKGISDNLDYIADMGFTSVWLNPILENAMPIWSYHGYATTDYYLVDPRFGTNEQYRQLVADMKDRGIGMVMDLIVNHIGTGHWWMDDLPTHDWLNFQDAFEPTTHKRTTNMDPYATEYDKVRHADGWFVEAMPDLNQRNPLLADYLVQNAIWWIEYVGLQGIRIDTWPYPDKHFMTEWTRRIMQEYPDFNMVGEEWSENPAVVSYWQRGKQNHDGYVSYLPSLFDFPVQAALMRALMGDVASWNGVWTPLYELVGTDFLYPNPMSLVIFPDNHDMNRIYTQLEENDDLYKMAMVYYATMRGIPQFFYGDEILASHMGTSSHGELRSDFPGGWEGDTKNAFTGDGLTGKER
ncbi:MAG: cyclomaltodextrinase N-terminal domain-containing protein, partial [Woeseiaceae bacterium]|nr:cyclomaltodextrinase N-terminal domain-containing protein [Woeseiaceae bacterium]